MERVPAGAGITLIEMPELALLVPAYKMRILPKGVAQFQRTAGGIALAAAAAYR